MILPDVGGFIYDQALAVATRTITPLADRALLARRINLSNPSANDNWTVNVGGREIMRFRELTVGNQRLLRLSDSDQRPKPDFFEYCRNVLQLDPTVPVPNGQSLIISSVGGATADIDVELEEVSVSDGNIKVLNHYLGNTFLVPVVWFLNAGQAAPGVFQVDTQVGPLWLPSLFSNLAVPVNWKIEVLSLFFEGMGVNTFSGAANHQSVTQDVHWFRDNVQMFTRIGHGIPDEGAASAAGSANTVFGQRSGIFRPFEIQMVSDDPKLPAPLVFAGGDVSQIFLDITGDLTGTAAYSNCLLAAILRVTTPGLVAA